MARISKYTKELLEPIVAISESLAGVITKLGLNLTGGNYTYIRTKIKNAGIDTSHFTGQLWHKGKTAETHPGIRKSATTLTIPNEEIFVENCRPITGPRLQKRLLALGWELKCAIVECGVSTWLGKKIALHVDHVNGVHNDNRLINLRFLCPNCHQQTETWGNKNKTAS